MISSGHQIRSFDIIIEPTKALRLTKTESKVQIEKLRICGVKNYIFDLTDDTAVITASRTAVKTISSMLRSHSKTITLELSRNTESRKILNFKILENFQTEC